MTDEHHDADDAPLFDDPYRWFVSWLDEATGLGSIPEPNAFTLATATADGRPSARTVLLKEHGPQELVFYTNLDSRKGQEIEANPQAAALFYWRSLARQVRAEGPVRAVAPERADAYFASRPYLSRIGAWASHQSQPLDSRQALLERVEALQQRYPDGEPVPRPPRWSGFAIEPVRWELWAAEEGRLHDRWLFVRQDDGSWRKTRLNP